MCLSIDNINVSYQRRKKKTALEFAMCIIIYVLYQFLIPHEWMIDTKYSPCLMNETNKQALLYIIFIIRWMVLMDKIARWNDWYGQTSL